MKGVFREAAKNCLNQSVRAKMRLMGDFSDVQIEPPEQTNLLDVCLMQNGAVGGGVPGGRS